MPLCSSHRSDLIIVPLHYSQLTCAPRGFQPRTCCRAWKYFLCNSPLQGSTKVFKTRTHKHHAESSYIPSDAKELATSRTTQCIDTRVSTDAILLLLPDPVTPFSSASYSQTQTFYLEEHSSAVILDWFTSGRMARGEEWAFEKYRSVNEIWKQGRRIARDVMLLESPKDSVSATNGNVFSRSRSVRERLAPYACYATLFILVPSKSTTLMNEINPEASTPSPIRLRTYHKLTEIISQLSEAYDEIRQMQTSSPDSIIWSLSPLNQPVPAESNGAAGSGLIIRVAGLTTELVRNWLKKALAPLNGLIGHDAYKNAFA